MASGGGPRRAPRTERSRLTIDGQPRFIDSKKNNEELFNTDCLKVCVNKVGRAPGSDETRTDEALVELVLVGQVDVFVTLYERYYTRAHRLAYGMTGHREAAEDLTQEIFMRAFQKLSHYDRRSSFATWFYRLTVNCCLNHRQKEKRRAIEGTGQLDEVPGLDEPDQMEAIILQKQIQNEVHQALLSLKPKLRLMVILKDIEGLSYEEIADRTSCSMGTIASRLNRARNLLARKLEHLRGTI
jgi:RNA polymerase sigma-70 factor (ECF subfamily)